VEAATANQCYKKIVEHYNVSCILYHILQVVKGMYLEKQRTNVINIEPKIVINFTKRMFGLLICTKKIYNMQI